MQFSLKVFVHVPRHRDADYTPAPPHRSYIKYMCTQVIYNVKYILPLVGFHHLSPTYCSLDLRDLEGIVLVVPVSVVY